MGPRSFFHPGLESVAPGNPPLPLGYSPVARGRVVSVVTFLEMNARPGGRPAPPPPEGVALRPFAGDADVYRELFRRVGEDWLWFSRLTMPEEELRGLLADPDVHVSVLERAGRGVGLLELDFREPGVCELALLGLVREEIGRGLGRWLVAEAVRRAWERPIERLRVHTCTFDHPRAAPLYRGAGFRPVGFAVEVAEDPRLSGVLSPDVAPHVPRID
jgi:GNAT superfamily N-acetyltransferase